MSEKEITSAVNMCDASGALNPAAHGWARHPIINCNLSGRFTRKKRWNYWCVTTPDFAFSATIADIDYLALASLYIVDFKEKKVLEKTIPLPFGAGARMKPAVEDDAFFKGGGMEISMVHSKGGLDITASCSSFHGNRLTAEVRINEPAGHETLNVVVPWNSKTFQFTSKQNTLPATGFVKLGTRTLDLPEGSSFGCLDFGRGIWPYSTKWNWASFSTIQGDDVIGMNAGGMWTDGTGSTENGLCVNGKLFKISDDSVIKYDRSDWLKPWTLKTNGDNSFDLTFKPFLDKRGNFNLGVLKTAVHQCFGHFNGTVTAEGKKYQISEAVGWAEEAISKW